MKKLYLVDSSIYVFRGWHSLPAHLRNVHGEQNNAFRGFSDFVYHFLQAERPSQLVFAFDESLHHCARKAIYPEYKANRAPAPDELKRQFAWCRQWVEALGISSVSSNRFEADDLIGSLAQLHRSETQSIVILTADKDLAQLIREGDQWWSFATGQQLGYKNLIKKFGLRPEQIADQLAIAGDKVDNIPGIPGIGMAIAARLLTKFETLENLRENIDKVKLMKFRGSARIMNLLKEHEKILEISAQLTPINCKIDEMKAIPTARSKADRDRLQQMMNEQDLDAARQQKWWTLVDALEAAPC
jgi:5'-3' exonuclease